MGHVPREPGHSPPMGVRGATVVPLLNLRSRDGQSGEHTQANFTSKDTIGVFTNVPTVGSVQQATVLVQWGLGVDTTNYVSPGGKYKNVQP